MILDCFDRVFHFSTKSQTLKILNRDDGNSISGLITNKHVFAQNSSAAVGPKQLVSLDT